MLGLQRPGARVIFGAQVPVMPVQAGASRRNACVFVLSPALPRLGCHVVEGSALGTFVFRQILMARQCG
jgi:hypothetical protein